CSTYRTNELFVVSSCREPSSPSFFLCNEPVTTEIYTLSLHDALPIYVAQEYRDQWFERGDVGTERRAHLQNHDRDDDRDHAVAEDRKSTRLNSSHQIISYAVFCLKKKKVYTMTTVTGMRLMATADIYL